MQTNSVKLYSDKFTPKNTCAFIVCGLVLNDRWSSDQPKDNTVVRVKMLVLFKKLKSRKQAEEEIAVIQLDVKKIKLMRKNHFSTTNSYVDLFSYTFGAFSAVDWRFSSHFRVKRSQHYFKLN